MIYLLIISLIIIGVFIYFKRFRNQDLKSQSKQKAPGICADEVIVENRYLLRRNEAYDIVCCEIDNLDMMYQIYGIDTLEKVLNIVEKNIKKHFKKSDIVIRYDNELFIVFLVKNQNSQNYRLYNRVQYFRKKIELLLIKIDNISMDITMSFGISFYQENNSYSKQLLLAEKALNYSKEKGKNKIAIFNYKENKGSKIENFKI
jgi:diguanylate cyclase (GGDEF)-like protein